MSLRSRTARALEILHQDVAYALRALRRSPGPTATIILTLALGVGANAAVFSALDRVFFRAPAGVRDPNSVRRLYAHIYSERNPQYGPTGKVTPFLTTRDLLEQQGALEGSARIVGDYLDRRGRLVPGDQPVRMTFVSPGYFDVLGVRPQRGRFFAPDESRLPGAAAPVAIISDAFWRSHLGADPSVVGKTLHIDETIYSIIGVAPREFEGLELEVVDLWAPLSNVEGGDITSLRLLARVEPGVDTRSLDRSLTAQYRRTHAGDPSIDARSEIISASILAARGPALAGVSVLRIPGMTERSLSLLARLAGAGLIVLVIACANAGSLLLMRAIRRRREIAVRVALGISRPRLVLQLLVESVMLSAVAVLGALILASWTGQALRAQLAAFRWPGTIVDHRVIVFALLVALVVAVAAGVAPVAFALRTDVSASLKFSWAGTANAGTTVRTALLVTQAALCTALLACGGAFLNSLRRAEDFDRGFEPKRTIQVAVPAHDADAEQQLVRIADRLRSTPAIEAVGRSYIPIGGIGLMSKVGLSYRDTIGVGPRGPSLEFIDAGYPRAAGLRLVDGRVPTSEESFAFIALLSESLAKALFPNGKAVGSCVHVREPGSPCREVIGVVRDVRWDVTEPPVYRVYIPVVQAWTIPNRALVPNYLYVRTRSIASGADVARLRSMIGPMMTDPGELRIQRMSEMLAPQLRPWRLAATLFLILGALGLIAAVAGIYGLVAYDVTQRSRELAVRIALGATSPNIVRLVLNSGLRVVLIGLSTGIVAALALGRVMASLLFATAPYDPVILAGTVVTLTAAATTASVLPALRAMRVNPATALTAE